MAGTGKGTMSSISSALGQNNRLAEGKLPKRARERLDAQLAKVTR